jgi:hypothetical protein
MSEDRKIVPFRLSDTFVCEALIFYQNQISTDSSTNDNNISCQSYKAYLRKFSIESRDGSLPDFLSVLYQS